MAAADESEPIIDTILNTITDWVFYSVDVGGASLPLIVVWLIVAAVFFTFYLKFLNLRGFTHAIDLVRGRYSKPEDEGEVSHFQARPPPSPAPWAWATSPVWPSRSP